MDECRCVVERLHQIRLDRILEQQSHCPGCLQITGSYGLAIVVIGNYHLGQSLLKILQVSCKA